MANKRRGINIPAHILNPRRKPRPKASWRYEGPETAQAWTTKADETARILHAASMLMDGRSGNARLYKQTAEQLRQGIVCVFQLLDGRVK